MTCLLHKIRYLLDQQLRILEKVFLKQGGFTEKLYRSQTQMRGRRRNP
jgi:four helix bundle suffix protein